MGTVELAVRRDGTFQRLYAIKRLHAHLREEPDVRAMFLDEARIAGLIRHSHVVSVVDVGDDDQGPFLVMEYVEGVAVGQIIERSIERAQPVPMEVALRIGMQAALGLHAAHELVGPDGAALGLVHRDVSPYNILVGFDGIARVTDFGIAKALGRAAKTSRGILKGKLGYMAPEQLRFKDQDRRSDLFSLGVVLFELLTSTRLYPGNAPEQSAQRILEEPPPDLLDFRDDAAPELVGLIFKLLAKSAEHRPSDARSVARTLETILHELTAERDLVDTSEYLERQFADDRRRMQEELAQELARLDSETQTNSASDVEKPPMRAAIFRPLSLLAVGLAAVSAVAIWRFRPDSSHAMPTLGKARTVSGLSFGTPAVAAAPSSSPDTAPAPASAREAGGRSTERARAPSQRADRARGRDKPGGDVRIWGWR
jgi:serine/threonine-protein kinase